MKFTHYPRASYAFIAASFLNSMGSAFLWPLTVIYVHTALHRSYGDAGLVLLLQAFAGVLGQWLGGALYYRMGLKTLVIGSLILCGLTQGVLAFVGTWTVYLGLMFTMGLLMSITMPVVNALIGFQWPEHRRQLFNVVYVWNNVGMAVGTTVGGLVASLSFVWTFLSDGASTCLFALFFWAFLRNSTFQDDASLSLSAASKRAMGAQRSAGGGAAAGAGATGTNGTSGTVLSQALWKNYRMYLFVGVGGMLTWFSTSMYGAGIAPYLTDHGKSPAVYSFLWTVNGIIILIGQPLLSWFIKRVANTLTRQLMWSSVLYFSGFAFITLFHGTYYDFVVGMVMTTFGEMMMAPTIPAFISETTGTDAPYYLGLVGALGSVGRMIGPYVYGHAYDFAGLTPVLYITLFMMLCSYASFAMQHRLSFQTLQSKIESQNLDGTTPPAAL